MKVGEAIEQYGFQRRDQEPCNYHQEYLYYLERMVSAFHRGGVCCWCGSIRH